MVPNLDILVFREILQISKFEGADFKHGNSFSKNLAPKISKEDIFGQKYPNKTFLVPNLGIFIISQYLAIGQIQGC